MLVDPALRAAVDTLPRVDAPDRRPPLRLVGRERRAGAGSAAGKAIRPALALLAAEAVGGGAGGGGAGRRRGRARAQLLAAARRRDGRRRHPPPPAHGVDACSASARRSWPATRCWPSRSTCSRAAGTRPPRPAMRRLSAAVQELVDGQSADIAFEPRADVDLAEVPADGRGEDRRAARLRLRARRAVRRRQPGAGRPAARASASGWGWRSSSSTTCSASGATRRVTGKSVYSDLRSRKKSLPVVAALTSGTAAGQSWPRSTSATSRCPTPNWSAPPTRSSSPAAAPGASRRPTTCWQKQCTT